MTAEPVSRSEIEYLFAQFELRMERRLGAMEADLREIKAKMIIRNGPVTDEIRKIEERQAEMISQVNAASKRLETLMSRDEVKELTRQVVTDQAIDKRGSSDFGMRIVLFGISIGTLIFVVRGQK